MKLYQLSITEFDDVTLKSYSNNCRGIFSTAEKAKSFATEYFKRKNKKVLKETKWSYWPNTSFDEAKFISLKMNSRDKVKNYDLSIRCYELDKAG